MDDLTAPFQSFIIDDEITVTYYTQAIRETPVTTPIGNISYLYASDVYKRTRENIFIIHDKNTRSIDSISVALRNAILDNHNVNVFVVNWSKIAFLSYRAAASAVPDVGNFVAKFIKELMDEYNLSPRRFRLVGHGMGAHIAGAAGKALGGDVAVIIGLDPSGPLFTISDTDNRLDESDARFVEVIHTNSELLGMHSAMGHADYYVNGGARQPGCGPDVFGHCSHDRSFHYYAETIEGFGHTSFICPNSTDFDCGNCYKNDQSIMGGWCTDVT